MFISPQRGRLLQANGTPFNSKTLAKLCGENEDIITNLLTELKESGVTGEFEGIISNRRMVKEEELSQVRSEAGIKGLSKRWGKKYSKVIAKGNSKSIANTGKDREVSLSLEVKAVKKKYLEFVMLTEEEYQKLIKTFGQKNTDDYIKRLNDYIGSKGKKYKSHYHTILVWNDMHKGEGRGRVDEEGDELL